MLLVNTRSGENVEVPESKVDEMVRSGSHSFVGGPESVVNVRTISGRVSSVYPGRAAAVIQEGGSFVPAGEFERMQDNQEFASSTLGALSAVPYGFDDWMFAGAGGNALEAMGLTPEGMREEVQSANPFIWNASGLTPTAMAVLMSGGTYGAARAAGGTALSAAKTAARQAGSSASKGAVLEAAKNLGKAGYYGTKAATVGPFNMVTASEVAGNWAAKGVNRAVSHLAGRPVATSLANKDLARFIGTTAARTASGVSRGLVEGGVWGAGEGLSEAMLGPSDQVAETVLEHIKTNALIGAAFGGAVSNVIPALTGAKRAMLSSGKLGMRGVGYGQDRIVDKMRPWLLKLGEEMGLEPDELKWYENLLQPGNIGDDARKQQVELIKRIDRYSTDVASQIESMFLIEDLRQMADVNGHDLGVVLNRIAGSDSKLPFEGGSVISRDSDGSFVETWSKSSARPGRTDAAITPGEAVGRRMEEDIGQTTIPGTRVRADEKMATKRYTLPGVNDLLSGSMELFATAKTALLELAEKEPKRDANFELTRMVKKIMDMEAGFYRSIFSERTKQQFLANSRKARGLSDQPAPLLDRADRKAAKTWEDYWARMRDPETPLGKRAREEFNNAARKKGLAEEPGEVRLFEDYFPESPTAIDAPSKAKAPLGDLAESEYDKILAARDDVRSEVSAIAIDIQASSKFMPDGEPLLYKLENDLDSLEEAIKEVTQYVSLGRVDVDRIAGTQKYRLFESPEIYANTVKAIRLLEDIQSHLGIKRPGNALINEKIKALQALLKTKPGKAAPAAKATIDESTRKVFDHLTTSGIKPTISGVQNLLGISNKAAKIVMDQFVQAGLLVKKKRGYGFTEDAPSYSRVDPDPTANRYDPEDFEQAIIEAVENENPDEIIKLAEELGVELRFPKMNNRRLDPEFMKDLVNRKIQAGKFTAIEEEHIKIWNELIAVTEEAIAGQGQLYGRMTAGDDLTSEQLARIKYDYRHTAEGLSAYAEGRPNYPPSLLNRVITTSDGSNRLLPELVRDVIETVGGAQSRSASLAADLYGYLEHLSTDMLKATQSGPLRGTLPASQIVDTVIEPIRQRLKDRNLWLGQAKAKDDFDQLAGDFEKYRQQIISDFGTEVGPDLVADPDKVLTFISNLNKYNIKPSSMRLNGYMDTGIDLLKKIKSDFQSVDLSEIAKLDPERIKEFQKRWERLAIADPPPSGLGGKALWDWYLDKLVKRFEHNQGNLVKNVEQIQTDFPKAKLFMGANAQAANLSQMTSEMSRGGIASFMAYALTGSPMAAAATGAGVGLATIGQNPQRMANFLHLISTFKNATDSYLDEGIEAWRNDSLPRMAEARGWEKKARQMLLMTPGVVTRDIEETRTEMGRRSGAEKSNKYWVDRATKSFASQMTKEQYVETRESLTKLMMSPSTMNHFLEKSTELFEDTPDLRDAMKKSIRTKIQSAYSSMPKGTRAGFGAPMIEPTSLELREWGAKLQILNSPLDAMFSSMMSGTLTPEMVKTFKQNWPQLHTQLIEKAMASMNNPEYGQMSQQQRMMLNILLEGQFLNPSVAERLLQNYREEEGKKQGGAPQAAAPRMMKRETEQMITAMQTPMEQILA